MLFAILIGILLCFMGACNAVQALADPNPTSAFGGGVIALVFFLLGVPLLIYGAKSKKTPPTPPASTLRPCPFCAEPIQLAAKICRFCDRDVEPGTEA